MHSTEERGTGGDAGSFDGVVCIGGEDWWYHNRGHFDFQIMRRLARRWPVLFVNSLGVRMPSLTHDKHFAARIRRKLASLAKGAVNVENRFWVFSPFMIPGARGQQLSDWALAPQIRLAAHKAGIRKPLLWIHCPAGAPLATRLPAAAVVMQRTDRFEAFPEGDASVLRSQIEHLQRHADLVVYAAPALMAEETGRVKRQLLVTHGVDLETFRAAGEGKHSTPADVAPIAGPRIGFVGGIDAHTFDPPLFLEVARRMPECSFVLVGGCSLPEGWCRLPNVHLLGRKPYDEVAGYMAAMDALIMPWNDSSWIKACNPIKLKEYLAVGRPVVTTNFDALDGWRHLVRVAKGPEAFAAAIRSGLAERFPREAADSRLASETWDAKADLVATTLTAGLGLHCAGAAEPLATIRTTTASAAT
jgi:glycosyltransferase involved in cell wall biosynthesis